MPEPTRRLDAVLRAARRRVAPLEADLLLAHVLGTPRSWLFAHGDSRLTKDNGSHFETLLTRRESGEPLAYLVGSREFYGLTLTVTSDTLIPRPDTELLVELALARLPPSAPVRVLELGTGSGAIALALATARPNADIIATDCSPAALAVAQTNAAALAIDSIDFRHGDWYAALDEVRVDLIVSNPPYIAADDPHLAVGDLRFEPRTALTPGRDGLQALRDIIGGAAAHLDSGGWLLLEHGYAQGATVRALLAGAGFYDVDTACDLEQRERVSLARMV